MSNLLYYGDNLDILREHVRDESIDLIYLDPPFNSNAAYNVLFSAPAGQKSESQVEAFQDTWHWGDSAARAFEDVLRSRHTDVATLLQAMRRFLGESDLMAYLAMMAVRLIELHRVLKPTGSLYLHCDSTSSHYLKILLDSIFGNENYLNEIIWKRRVGMSSAVHESNNYGNITDTIFFYARSRSSIFHAQYNKDDPDYQRYITERFTQVDDAGRKFQPTSLVNPALRPNLKYEYKGYKPPPNGWMITQEKMEQWDKEGRIYFPKNPDGRLRRKSYADELRGMPVQNLWTDIPEINSQAAERLGYPTQKPLALLERIISASSNPGDIVLDPFCGCGTAVHAAQKLGRQWVGIDVTHLAISLIERRLKDAFAGIAFEVHGTPKDFGGARDLAARDKYQFQWWAVSLVDAVPQGGQKKGADRGIDGIRWVRTGPNTGDVERVLVSVKGGDNVGVGMVRDLKGTMEREGAIGGLFLTLAEPTKEMRREATASGFFDTGFGTHPKLQIVTIRELLAGMRPDLPPLGRNEGFRRAPREHGKRATQTDLGI